MHKAFEEANAIRRKIVAEHPFIWRFEILATLNGSLRSIGWTGNYFWSEEEAEANRPKDTDMKIHRIQRFDSTTLSIDALALQVQSCQAYDCFEPVWKKGKKCAQDDCNLPLCEECAQMGRTHCESHRERGG